MPKSSRQAFIVDLGERAKLLDIDLENKPGFRDPLSDDTPVRDLLLSICPPLYPGKGFQFMLRTVATSPPHRGEGRRQTESLTSNVEGTQTLQRAKKRGQESLKPLGA